MFFSAIVVPIIADVIVLSIEQLTLTISVTLVTNGGKPTSHYYVSPNSIMHTQFHLYSVDELFHV